MDKPFIIAEVQKAIDKLHFRKGSGYDGISSEHVKFAGPVLVRILTLLYNLVVSSEYIPVNFRRGVQVPLYKGKNQCVLDMNNYRGITLLTNFNKIFEILVWGRLETWWVGNGKISNLQGACRKGQSCIHTAFLLQETVSTALERHKSVFVAFYDVLIQSGLTGCSLNFTTWVLLGRYGVYFTAHTWTFSVKSRLQGVHPIGFKCIAGFIRGGFSRLSNTSHL